MFYIYKKENLTTKSPFNRYFKSFENAKKCMLKDIEDLQKIFGKSAKCLRKLDEMNMSKGFYEFEQIWEIDTLEGKQVMSYALIQAYFWDT